MTLKGTLSPLYPTLEITFEMKTAQTIYIFQGVECALHTSLTTSSGQELNQCWINVKCTQTILFSLPTNKSRILHNTASNKNYVYIGDRERLG